MIVDRAREVNEMGHAELGEMEQKFALIIWEKQPVSSGELVKICEKEFGWKKSTTYTMLKRLCQRGIFENQQGTVIAILSQEDFFAAQGAHIIEENFGGSLPRFLAAFTRKKALKPKEIQELQKLIDGFKEG